MEKTVEKQETNTLIASLEKVYRLKSIPRSGWVQSGLPVDEVESIASHSFGMSLLILYLRTELQANGINVARALNMALVHDLAETITGDLTPADNISAEAKQLAESLAFGQLTDQLQDEDYFRALWDEFEAGESREAQAVRRIDKLDMLIQAYLYEKKFSIRLDSFWENMDTMFRDSESESLYNYIRSNRFQVKG